MVRRKRITSRKNNKKRTQDEFEQLVYEVLPDVKILGKYVNAHTRVDSVCLVCGYEWAAIPEILIDGKGCPVCRGRFVLSEYLNQIDEKGIPVIPIEIPKTKYDYTIHLCTKHDEEFITKPSSVLKGCGCKKCRYEKIGQAESLEPDVYAKRLAEQNPYITQLEDYTSSYTKIKFKCKRCGYVWKKFPSSALTNGCPKCNLSKGEKRVAKWLDMNNVKYTTQYQIDGCMDKRLLRFDFYIPSINTCIEYQGIQHFEKCSFGCKDQEEIDRLFENTKERDMIKRQFCKKNAIRLLEIPYWDFDSIDSILCKELQIAS